MHFTYLVFQVSVFLIKSVKFILNKDLEVANCGHHLLQLLSQLFNFNPQRLIIYTKILNLCYRAKLSKCACSHNIHLGTHALV